MRYKLLFLLLPLLAVTACEKQNSGAGDNTDAQAPYTLSVDKSTIESDGKDCVVFKLTDANGKVLTDDTSLMSKIYFINEATGKRLARKTKEFRSVEDGTYTFSATFKGDKCENTVTVSSVNRTKYEVFRKNVAIYRFTSTKCVNCPSMTEGLNDVDDWTKSRIVELGLHGYDSEYIYSDGSKYVADHLVYNIFKTGGYPSCVYDLELGEGTRDKAEIEGIIYDRLANSPATCGIKASSSYQNGQLTVSARIKSSTGGKYDIGFAILKDNCVPKTTAYEDVYNNVVIAMTGNYVNMSTSRFDLVKDAESSEVSQSITMTVGENLSEYSVVAYALKENNGKVVIDNIVELPFNGSVDYVYNK